MSRFKRRKKETESQRPSLFFIIALIVGLVLLLWAAIVLGGRPMQPTTLGSAHSLPAAGSARVL